MQATLDAARSAVRAAQGTQAPDDVRHVLTRFQELERECSSSDSSTLQALGRVMRGTHAELWDAHNRALAIEAGGCDLTRYDPLFLPLQTAHDVLNLANLLTGTVSAGAGKAGDIMALYYSLLSSSPGTPWPRQDLLAQAVKTLDISERYAAKALVPFLDIHAANIETTVLQKRGSPKTYTWKGTQS